MTMPEVEAATAIATAVAKAVAEAIAAERSGAHMLLLDARLAGVEKELAEVKLILAAISKAADRWKGGFILVVAAGAFITWLLSVGGGLKGLFK